MSFIRQYIKNPKLVGAVAPSSSFLAKKMISDIDFSNIECIVELGSGTGVFTKELLSRCEPNTRLVLFEINDRFASKLKCRYKSNPNVVVVNDSAENIKYHLDKLGIKSVKYIISGLPFTSLPSKISTKILESTKDILVSDGVFITFQYSLLKKSFFENHGFDIEYDHTLFNIPPAFVFKCRQKEKNI